MNPKEIDTLTSLLNIDSLVQGWMFRDLAQWDKLRTLFHSDGTIEVTWFEGKFSDFVDASEKMSASDLRAKHMIGSPVIEIVNDRAIAETNGILACENVKLNLGCNMHIRFFDLLERREGVWKILKRYCLYDMGTLTFPFGIVEIDLAYTEQFPREYAALGYLLGKSGFPVWRIFPTRGSDQEKTIKADARLWLLCKA
jgi:hypothetical protein